MMVAVMIMPIVSTIYNTPPALAGNLEEEQSVSVFESEAEDDEEENELTYEFTDDAVTAVDYDENQDDLADDIADDDEENLNEIADGIADDYIENKNDSARDLVAYDELSNEIVEEYSNSVDSFDSLETAINNAPNNDEYVIEIISGFDITSEVVIPTDKNIILASDGNYVLTTQDNFRHFSVVGTLTLTDGIILTNFDSQQSGGGIKIKSDGCFIMRGGMICGNNESLGGGVSVFEGTFLMRGGEISGNTGTKLGGGVYNNSTFIMEGGNISGNNAIYGGGGVLNRDAFTIEGGLIGSNSADYGGGILTTEGSSVISGGIISGNNAIEGGGVYIDWNGSLLINSGAVSGNTAELGGGICIDWGTLLMKGGKINSNKSNLGGGVYVNYLSSFLMESGLMHDNAATGGFKPDCVCRCCRDEQCTFGNDDYFCTICREEINACVCTFGSGGGVFTTDYTNLTVGADAVFSGNKAATAHGRDPAFNSIYGTNVNATSWTAPFIQGFNNYDINSNGPVIEIMDIPDSIENKIEPPKTGINDNTVDVPSAPVLPITIAPPAINPPGTIPWAAVPSLKSAVSGLSPASQVNSENEITPLLSSIIDVCSIGASGVLDDFGNAEESRQSFFSYEHTSSVSKRLRENPDMFTFIQNGTVSWAILNLILTLAGVALASLMAIRVLLIKKHYNLTIFAFLIILSFAGVLLFLLTQDLRGIKTLVNIWTPLHMTIFAAAIISLSLISRRFKKNPVSSEPPSQAYPFIIDKRH